MVKIYILNDKGELEDTEVLERLIKEKAKQHEQEQKQRKSGTPDGAYDGTTDGPIISDKA